MGYFSGLDADMRQAGVEVDWQSAQKHDEEIRHQLAVEALHRLSCGLGGEREIQILAAEIGVSDEFRR